MGALPGTPSSCSPSLAPPIGRGRPAGLSLFQDREEPRFSWLSLHAGEWRAAGLLLSTRVLVGCLAADEAAGVCPDPAYWAEGQGEASGSPAGPTDQPWVLSWRSRTNLTECNWTLFSPGLRGTSLSEPHGRRDWVWYAWLFLGPLPKHWCPACHPCHLSQQCI